MALPRAELLKGRAELCFGHNGRKQVLRSAHGCILRSCTSTLARNDAELQEFFYSHKADVRRFDDATEQGAQELADGKL